MCNTGELPANLSRCVIIHSAKQLKVVATARWIFHLFRNFSVIRETKKKKIKKKHFKIP